MDDTDKPPVLDWSGEMGEYWLENLARFERANEAVGEALLAHAAYVPGERVVEIGAGGGRNTGRIARAVGDDGLVVGLDISPALAAEARRWLSERGVTNARIEVADAATARPDGTPFDRLYSRYGVMFFSDFPAAFANLHSLLREGGRLDMAVWATLAENPWRRDVIAIVRRHMDLPVPPPRAPGPFALGERGFLSELLDTSGFHDIGFVAWTGMMMIGDPGATPSEAAETTLQAMELDALPGGDDERRMEKIRRDLIDFLSHNSNAEGVFLDAKAWIVTAYA